jgi:hypothetical protein
MWTCGRRDTLFSHACPGVSESVKGLQLTVNMTAVPYNNSSLFNTNLIWYFIHMSVHPDIIPNYSQQDATFLLIIYFYRRSRCFRRFLRSSSGAHNCTYFFRCCQPILLLAASSSSGWQHFPQYVCSAQYGCFCSSIIFCFPGMLLRYCLSDFEIVPVTPVVSCVTFAFKIYIKLL